MELKSRAMSIINKPFISLKKQLMSWFILAFMLFIFSDGNSDFDWFFYFTKLKVELKDVFWVLRRTTICSIKVTH